MKYFQKVADIDPVPLLLQLQRHPELWDAQPERRAAPDSPHAAMTDIWLRYNDDSDYRAGKLDWSGFNDAHFPIWYPAVSFLPAVRPLVHFLAARCEAVAIGGVLLTRIAAGGSIEPHADRGWHPEHYNCKLYVVLQSSEKCVNRVEGETVRMKPGEVWFFDNTREHEVINAGVDERITLIVCLRCEP